MSRAARSLAAVLVATAVPAVPGAYAEQPAGASEQCVVSDPRIQEASGLIATDDGYRIVNDGGTQVTVYRLDESCAVTGTTTAAIDPYDVEDLARGPDGSLWLADIGDNRAGRTSIAVIVVPDEAGAVDAVLRRLQYPDGPRDAESMFVDEAGRAVVLTKTFSGAVEVYRSQPIDPSPSGSEQPQPLERLGAIQLPQTGTAGGPVGPPLNNLMATGAARCGDQVALRTYTDVFVWRGADPAHAIIEQTPATAPLPVQPQGESVAFTPACDALVVHGEGVAQPIWTLPVPHATAADYAPPSAGPQGAGTQERSVQTRTIALLGGGLAAALLGLAWAVRHARRRR